MNLPSVMDLKTNYMLKTLKFSLSSLSITDLKRRFKCRQPVWEMKPRNIHRKVQKWKREKKRRKYLLIVKQPTIVGNWVSITLVKSGRHTACPIGCSKRQRPLYISFSLTWIGWVLRVKESPQAESEAGSAEEFAGSSANWKRETPC